MKLTLKESILLTGVVIFIATLLFTSFRSPEAQGAAYPGSFATVATSSRMTVTTTPSMVLATSSCVARIVTTVASPITISFADATTLSGGITPSGFIGHVQAASTTAVYDGGLYGCGAMRIYSFVAGDITVTETR